MKRLALLGFAILGLGMLVAAAGCSSIVQVQTIGLSAVGPEVGLVLDKNLTVVDIVQGSAAEKAGVKKGDVLRRVNNSRVTPNNATKTFRNLDKSKTVALVVLREGVRLNLDVVPAPILGHEGAPTSTPMPNDMLYF